VILVLRSLLASVLQVYTHISITLVSSLITLAADLPFLALLFLATMSVRSYVLIPLSVLLFLGVLPYPGNAAGQVIAHELATSDLIVTSDAWRGFDGNWQPALRAWLVGVVVTIGLIANVTFYTHLASGSGAYTIPGYVLSVVTIGALSLWITIHLYVYPLLLAMEEPRLLLVYRNALVLLSFHPIASILGTLIWLTWLALGAATGVFFAGGFLVAATIQHNIFTRLPLVRRP
jgi:hypothetical protein